MDNAISKHPEQIKYEKVWGTISTYGINSPAMKDVESVIEICTSLDVKTVLDAGCGCGRAFKRFKDTGFDVTGVDITDNCIDGDIREALLPYFVQMPLWDMPLQTDSFDMVFCVDVLEHIPPAKLYATLAELARVCNRFAYFKIAKYKDGYGATVGESLHLSIHPTSEWIHMIEKHFDHINIITDGSAYLTVICEPICRECKR